MVWMCIPSESECVVRIYSISDDIFNVMTNVLNFVFNIAPGLWVITALVVFASLCVILVFSVRKNLMIMRSKYG